MSSPLPIASSAEGGLEASGLYLDTVEKRPLYHFHPGTSCLTLAVVGCGLDCPYCINADHARRAPEVAGRWWPVADILARLLEIPGACLAVSGAEPLLQAEALVPLFHEARNQGRPTIVASSLLVRDECWRAVLPHLDSVKVDLKPLQPTSWPTALDRARRAQAQGIHVEVSTVVLPRSVAPEGAYHRLAAAVHEYLGPVVPLHLVRFLPEHRLAHLSPPAASDLLRLRAELLRHFSFVYLDQPLAAGVQDTVCPGCGGTLVHRFADRVHRAHLRARRCPSCEAEVSGRLGPASPSCHRAARPPFEPLETTPC